MVRIWQCWDYGYQAQHSICFYQKQQQTSAASRLLTVASEWRRYQNLGHQFSVVNVEMLSFNILDDPSATCMYFRHLKEYILAWLAVDMTQGRWPTSENAKTAHRLNRWGNSVADNASKTGLFQIDTNKSPVRWYCFTEHRSQHETENQLYVADFKKPTNTECWEHCAVLRRKNKSKKKR